MTNSMLPANGVTPVTTADIDTSTERMTHMSDIFNKAWAFLTKGSPVPQYARTKDRDFGSSLDSDINRDGTQRTRRGSYMNYPRPTRANDKEVFMTGNVPLEGDFADRARDLGSQVAGSQIRGGKPPTIDRVMNHPKTKQGLDSLRDEAVEFARDNRRGMVTAEKMPAPSPFGRVDYASHPEEVE